MQLADLPYSTLSPGEEIVQLGRSAFDEQSILTIYDWKIYSAVDAEVYNLPWLGGDFHR